MILSPVFLPLLWWSNRSYSAERLIDWSPWHSHSVLINKLGNYEQESTVQWVKLAGKLASEGKWGQDSQCLVWVGQVLASATLINEDVHVMNWRVQAGREGQITGEGQKLKLQWYGWQPATYLCDLTFIIYFCEERLKKLVVWSANSNGIACQGRMSHIHH